MGNTGLKPVTTRVRAILSHSIESVTICNYGTCVIREFPESCFVLLDLGSAFTARRQPTSDYGGPRARPSGQKPHRLRLSFSGEHRPCDNTLLMGEGSYMPRGRPMQNIEMSHW